MKLFVSILFLGIHGHMIALLELMESWLSKVGAAVAHPEMMSISDWLELEQALHRWLSLVEKALQSVSCMQTGKQDDKIKPDMKYVFFLYIYIQRGLNTENVVILQIHNLQSPSNVLQ